eukprot:TRINITY_DN947_c0_g1_i1.p1 TRINITY_DN947_c0_g1~~TRINITY_DN947_c0_g1_i1.p1  ORF type:complete len:232 (-),score=62.84 TRINITY_DN947_c0_g1_i1:114-722(-)
MLHRFALRASGTTRSFAKQTPRRSFSTKEPLNASDAAKAQDAKNQRVMDQFQQLSEAERDVVVKYLESKYETKAVEKSSENKKFFSSVFVGFLGISAAVTLWLGYINRTGAVVKGRIVKVDPVDNTVTYRYRAFGQLFEKTQKGFIIPFGPNQKPYEVDQIVEIRCMDSNPRFSILDPPYFYFPRDEIATMILEDSRNPATR